MAGDDAKNGGRLGALLASVLSGVGALFSLLFFGSWGALGWVFTLLTGHSKGGWFGAFVTSLNTVVSWFCSKASTPWWVLRIMFAFSVASTIVATALQWERYNRYVYENQSLREMCEKHNNFPNSGRQINCESVMNNAWYIEGPLAFPLAVWWCFQAAMTTLWGGGIDWVLDCMGDNSYNILTSMGVFVWKHWQNVLFILGMSFVVASLCALGVLVYGLKGWLFQRNDQEVGAQEAPAQEVGAQEAPAQEVVSNGTASGRRSRGRV